MWVWAMEDVAQQSDAGRQESQEWMYELETEEARNPHQKYNAAAQAYLSGDWAAARRLLGGVGHTVAANHRGTVIEHFSEVQNGASPVGQRLILCRRGS